MGLLKTDRTKIATFFDKTTDRLERYFQLADLTEWKYVKNKWLMHELVWFNKILLHCSVPQTTIDAFELLRDLVEDENHRMALSRIIELLSMVRELKWLDIDSNNSSNTNQ